MAMTALRALIFVGAMYETGVVLALNEQNVRFFAACALELGGVVADKCSIRS